MTTTMLRVPRSRGALSGMLLVLLGLWGALVPFVGPYFRFAFTPAAAWTMTSGRVWLDIAPGAVVLVGGILLLLTASRPLALFGGLLAAAGGAWFVAGVVVSPLLAHGTLTTGFPVGGPMQRMAEELGFYAGLGVVIVFLAALAVGRLSMIGVRDTKPQRTAEASAERERAGAGAGSHASK